MSDVIQRRKLFHEVADRLREMILSGELPMGEALPSERELMERYGVGRPAIREALLSLEHAGLVTISGGERARVARPSAQAMLAGLDPAVRQFLVDPGGVRHLQAVRLLLEVGLVRQAAQTAGEADIARLRAALEENEAARGNLARFERTDVGFHYVFADLAGNPIFSAIHQATIGWLTEQRATTLRAPGAEAHAARAHRRIFEAVAARDPDRAEAEMQAHLTEVTRLYWHAREQGQAQ